MNSGSWEGKCDSIRQDFDLEENKRALFAVLTLAGRV